MDNLPEVLTSGSICGPGIALNSLAKINNDRTSPHEAFAIKRCLTNCLFEPCSFPSAMFADIEMDARSIWLFSEKHRVFSNRKKISLASFIASCQTNKSSNLVEVGMVVSFAKNNQSQSNVQIILFTGYSKVSVFSGCTCCAVEPVVP